MTVLAWLALAAAAAVSKPVSTPVPASVSASVSASTPASAAPADQNSAAQTAADGSIGAWVASVREAAALSEHEKSARVRARLAARARTDASACLAAAPAAAGCHYARALALGLAARARPGHAGALLKQMLDSLARAEAADPDFDEAGPERVRALVLIRAPKWPLGPGDVEEGVAAARRAVALRAGYAPNWLALAEAQAKVGDRSGSRASYEHARGAALALPPSDDRDGWLREADEALQQK